MSTIVAKTKREKLDWLSGPHLSLQGCLAGGQWEGELNLKHPLVFGVTSERNKLSSKPEFQGCSCSGPFAPGIWTEQIIPMGTGR